VCSSDLWGKRSLFEKQQEAQNAAAAQQEVSPENNEGDADVDAGNSD
jgi:hypothetical protein